MLFSLLLSAAATAQPEPDAAALLRTFRQEFVKLTPGEGKFPASFAMGSDDGPADQRPARQVRFAYAFYIAKYEVPQNLWQAVMGANPSRWKGPRNSVEMLSFDEAQQFCQRATQQLRALRLITERQQIRLPSEAEWEYAARAGTDTVYSFGNDLALLDTHGWHTGNAAGNDPPVGALKPNPWGLYDMHGYLWEWCADVGHKDHQDAPADGRPRGKGDTRMRVMRGGSWKDPAAALASRSRSGKFRSAAAPGGQLQFVGGVDKSLRDDAVGLRCVLADKRP